MPSVPLSNAETPVITDSGGGVSSIRDIWPVSWHQMPGFSLFLVEVSGMVRQPSRAYVFDRFQYQNESLKIGGSIRNYMRGKGD